MQGLQPGGRGSTLEVAGMTEQRLETRGLPFIMFIGFLQSRGHCPVRKPKRGINHGELEKIGQFSVQNTHLTHIFTNKSQIYQKGGHLVRDTLT